MKTDDPKNGPISQKEIDEIIRRVAKNQADLRETRKQKLEWDALMAKYRDKDGMLPQEFRAMDAELQAIAALAFPLIDNSLN